MNKILIRDYIPAVDAYGEYGLYEKINKVFLKNEGTSYFSGGNIKSVLETSVVTENDYVNGSHTLYANWEPI